MRRFTACLLAVVGISMTSMTAGEVVAPTLLGSVAVATEGEPVPLWQRVLLGESALMASWAKSTGNPFGKQQAKPEETSPEDAEQEQSLQGATPSQIEERTLSGNGSAYLNAAGISLFNRTKKAVDLGAVAAAGTTLKVGKAEAGPQVLIIHTHGTESFARTGNEPYTETGTAHTTDNAYNIIRVGDEVARIFTEMGLNVIHHTEFYDYPAYTGSYERSRAAVEAILKQYPSIQVVLDVHRDALVGTDGTIYKPVLDIDGVKTAQVMMLVGTDEAGAGYPDWTEHLALAMQIQQQMNALWPGLARPIVLRSASFNQQIAKGSLLVEVGSHGNTLEEAMQGARLFARAAGQVLGGYVTP